MITAEGILAVGSALSGKGGTAIISGGDTTVSVSKVTAGDATHTSDLNIQTGGNLIVTAGKDTETEHDSAKRKGFLRSGSASYEGTLRRLWDKWRNSVDGRTAGTEATHRYRPRWTNDNNSKVDYAINDR